MNITDIMTAVDTMSTEDLMDLMEYIELTLILNLRLEKAAD